MKVVKKFMMQVFYKEQVLLLLLCVERERKRERGGVTRQVC